MPSPEPVAGRCGAKLRGRDAYCTQWAGIRTDHSGAGHCWRHGGLQETADSPKVAADVERNLRATLSRLRPIDGDVDPRDLLMEEIRFTAGHVHWLRSEIEALPGGTEALIRGVKQVSQRTGIVMAPDGRQVPVDETTKVVGPGLHMLWQMYVEERKHLHRLTVDAIKAGIEERRVRLEEEQGVLMGRLITAVLGDLNLTEAQRGLVPAVVRRHLAVI
jgi:hypothetical protein